MAETKPGYDTLQKMLLTAEERAQLAEERATKAESVLEKIKRYLWGIVILVFDFDELMDNIIRHKERTVKEKQNVVK